MAELFRAVAHVPAVLLLSALSLPAPAPAAEMEHAGRPVGVDLDSLFSLTTHRGTHLSMADLRGRPFVVLFGYTHCPEFCPAALADLSRHLERLGADGNRLAVLFVTIDPERDTAKSLASYLESFDPRIVGLTGSARDVATVAATFGAKYERRSTQGASYSVDHSYLMFLVDKYGLLARRVGYDEPELLASSSARLLAQ
ncbi:SCO family protein [Methylobacterium segetis]|uniref:SCO family protein n=1 Tax=Methylobacterium segetis TaxID=2488750 RepID=UPI0014043E5F|nr:SCO family protein [Methylobacterium segetis]